VLRRLLLLRVHRLLALQLLRQLLRPLIPLLLPLHLRPVVAVVVVVAVAVVAPLLQPIRLLLRHRVLLRLLRRLLQADAVDNSAIRTTIRRSDVARRVWVVCRHSITQHARETLKRFVHYSMAARTSTRPVLTVRLRSQSPFSTPSGTLRWN